MNYIITADLIKLNAGVMSGLMAQRPRKVLNARINALVIDVLDVRDHDLSGSIHRG